MDDVAAVSFDPNSVPNTGNPYIEAARTFVRAVEWLNSFPFGDSRIQRANRRAARAAGFTGTRATLNAIGQGLRSNFPTGERRGPGPPVLYSTAPLPTPGPPPSVFEELLRRPPGPLDDLLRRPPMSEVQRILYELLRKPVNLPDLPGPVVKSASRAAVGVLGTAASVIGGLLWPSTIGQEPPWEPPTRAKWPRKGPQARRGRRTRKAPRTRPEPQPEKPPTVKPATTRPPSVRPEPTIDPRAFPVPAPSPGPIPVPTSSPVTIPSPRALPTWVTSALPYALPLGLAAFSSPRAPSRSARRSPLTSRQTSALRSPPSGPPDQCEIQRKRRPRKRSCTNPIVRTTRTTRGGSKFVTITREIKCPASSRKKLP